MDHRTREKNSRRKCRKEIMAREERDEIQSSGGIIKTPAFVTENNLPATLATLSRDLDRKHSPSDL